MKRIRSVPIIRLLLTILITGVYTIFGVTILQANFNTETVSGVGTNVGQYTAIATDKDGNLHVSYRDVTNAALKYVKRTAGVWSSTQTVDSAGAVGYYTSIAIDGSGNPHISYRDETNLDLKYAKFNGASWTLSTVDSAGNVGNYTSIAIDGSGNPHISYFDNTNSDLKYARYNGVSWSTSTLDSAGAVGYYTSIAIDGSGNPHISYYDLTNTDLKYAKYNGVSWTFSNVDFAVDVGYYISIAVDGSGNPHISYYDVTNDDLKYARFNGVSWTISTPDSAAVGAHTSIAIDGSGNPHISYQDNSNADLKYARFNGVSWITSTLDSVGNVGYFTSIAIDGSGNPHISYLDQDNGDLKVAHWSAAGFPAPMGGNARGKAQMSANFGATLLGTSSATWNWSDNSTNELGFQLYVSSGTGFGQQFNLLAGTTTLPANTLSYTHTGLTAGTSYQAYIAAVNAGGHVFSAPAQATPTGWSLETVDDGVGSVTGYYPSIAVDKDGNLHVSYRDNTNQDLRYIKRTGSIWGSPQTVDSAGNVGEYTSIAIDGAGNPHISYRDGTNNDLKYAKFNGVSWTLSTVDSAGNVGYNTSIAIDGSGNPHISYWDVTNADLKYARYNGTSWTISTLDSAGNVGDYTSIAIDGSGNPHISYKDQTNTDLKYARYNGTSWTLSTVDTSAGDVGHYTSIVIDGSGNPHISYTDVTNGDLKYARFNGVSWSLSTLDSAGDVGWYPSIAIDGAGNPHISYADLTGSAIDLKYARFNGVSWSTFTVDFAGLVGHFPSIAIDGAGNPHIFYYDETNMDLKAAHWGGTAYAKPMGGNARGKVQMPLNMAGTALGISSITWTWTDNASNELGYRFYYATASAGPFTLVADTTTLPAGSNSYALTGLAMDTSYYGYVAAVNAGGHVFSNLVSTRTATLFTRETVDSIGDVGTTPSIAVDKDGNLHLSYRDATNQDLRYIKRTGSVWGSPQTVDSAGDVGAWSSIAIDGSGNPHISYRDDTNTDLKYAKFNGVSWTLSTLDSSGDVGLYTSIAIDGAGNPHISYNDQINFNLKYAKYNGVSWSTSTLDSAGNVGYYTSLAIDGAGNPHISYNDGTNGDLKYARYNGVSWTLSTPDSAGEVGWYTSIAIDEAGNPQISYFDNTNGDLKYAKYNGVSWTLSTPDSPGDVGRFTSIAIDGSGNPQISYLDFTNIDLKYAKYNGVSWSTSTLDSAGDVGYFSSIAIDGSGNSHISYKDVTNGDGDLKVAHWAGSGTDGTPVSFTPPMGGNARGKAQMPANFGATLLGASSATWNWSDSSTNELGFRFYVSSGTGFGQQFTLVAGTTTLPANTLSYTQTGLTAGTSYQAYIAAVNAGGHVFSNPAQATPSGWSLEMVDGVGTNAGEYTAIAVDKDNNLHVTYKDDTNLDLRYIKRTGSVWGSPQTVDSAGSVGYLISIAVDGAGNPHISYNDATNADLKYAKYNGTSWTLSTVDSAGNVGEHTSIAIDGSGNPHISYWDGTNGDLKYAKYNGTSWTLSTVDSAGNVGYWSSIAIDGSGNPHITYTDVTNWDLKYAKYNGTSWTLSTVDSAGSVGECTSIAIDGSGNPHISYSDSTNSDLKYARYNGTSWTLSTVDSAGDVGTFTSIAIDGSGNPHISYTDSTNYDLKYAKYNGTSWALSTVDSAGNVGPYASIAIDGQGNPHISYWDGTNFDIKVAHWGGTPYEKPMGGNARGKVQMPTNFRADTAEVYVTSTVWRWTDNATNELGYRLYASTSGVTGQFNLIADTVTLPAGSNFYAHQSMLSGYTYIAYIAAVNPGGHVFSSSATAIPSAFSIETVDSAGNVGGYSSIAVDKDGNLHVSYSDTTNGDLRYVKRTGSAWGAPQTVDSAGDVGNFTSIAIDGSGNPHIAYKDQTNLDLKYAKWTGSAWSIQAVDSAGNVGSYTSIAIDGAGNPHISYLDGNNDDLKYARYNGVSWTLSTPDSAGNVGYYTSIAVDGAGNPHISYWDSTNGDLKYARYNGVSWTLSTPDSAGDVGRTSSIGLDGSGNPHISYWDLTNLDLKYARSNGTSWTLSAPDSGPTGETTSIAIDGAGNPHISYRDNTNIDLKYARYNGVSWSTSTLDSAGDVGYETSIAIDGSGNAHISYQDGTNGDLKVAHWVGAPYEKPMAGNARGKVQMPLNFTGTVLGISSITWTWTDNASNEFGYRLYVASPASGGFNVIATTNTLGPGSNTFTKEGLLQNTSYHVYAAAVNAGGVVTSSASLRYTLATKPFQTVVSTRASNMVGLDWLPNGNPEPGTDYEVRYSTDAGFGGAAVSALLSTSAVTITGLTSSSTYYLQARARNKDGIYSDYADSISTMTLSNTGDGAAPGAPGSPVAVQSGAANGIRLTWLASGDDDGIGALGAGSAYLIQHTTDIAGVIWSTSSAQITISTSGIPAGTSVSFSTITALSERTYFYTLWARDEAGNYSAASSVASAFSAPFSFEMVDSAGNVGIYTAMAIDKDGNLHVGYRDNNNLDLRYIKRTGGAWGTPQTLDSAGDVGWYISISIDGSGNPHISYYDQTNGDLKYVRWTGSTWDIQTLDSAGIVGRYSSIALDGSGNPHIAYHDATNDDLKYARYNGASWSLSTVDSSAGTMGWSASIAIDGSGNPHISYYDATNGDLKYARWTGAAWNISTVDMVGDVGNYTSIAIDGSGNPHISYRDQTNTDLKYVRWTGSTWDIQTVDAVGDVGVWTSIAIDGSGNPHISYYGGGLKYIRWTGSAWSIQTLDTDGSVGDYSSVAIDGSGNPHISYRDGTNLDLKVAHWGGGAAYEKPMGGNARSKSQMPTDFKGEVNFNANPPNITWSWTDNSTNEFGFRVYVASGAGIGQNRFTLVADSTTLTAGTQSYVWTGFGGTLTNGTSYMAYAAAVNAGGHVFSKSALVDFTVSPFALETVDSAGDVGDYISIAIDGSGNPHISYRDVTNTDLKYAKWTGSTWNIQTVDAVGNVGWWTSIAIDGSGNPHISYWDGSNLDLKYAKWTGSVWNIQTVDSAGTVGLYTSIAIDGSGNPHISYNDGTNFDLKYAKYNGTSWTLSTVDSAGDVGSYTSIAIDGSGNPHISYYDGTNLDLKYAKYNGASWSISTVDSAGDVGYYSSIAIDGLGNPHISYQYSTNADLKYAKFNGVSWSVSTLDSAVNVGYYTSIAIDGSGNPHISYYDSTNSDLKYARYNGASWTVSTIDSGDVGTYTSIAIDGSGNPHISYHDFTNLDLKLARWVGTAFAPPMAGNARGKVQAPTGLGAAIQGLNITWNWQDNSNSELGFRLYGAATSTGPFSQIAGINTLGPNTTSYTELGLTPNSTYFRYILCENLSGVVTSSGILVYLPGTPNAPTPLVAEAISSTTINWSWNDVNSGAFQENNYRVFTATGGLFVSLAADTTWYPLDGLIPNTSYTFRVQAFNAYGSSETGNLTRYTFAAKPGIPAQSFTPVFLTSVSVNWLAEGNPVGTKYLVELSTDQNFTGAGDVDTGWVSFNPTTHTFTGLSANSTYWLQVKSRNNEDIETLFTVLGATATLCEIPSAPTLTNIYSSSMTLSINTGTNPYWSKYAVKVTSGSAEQYLQGNNTLGGAVVYRDTMTWTNNIFITGLVPNTTHQINVSAQNSSGINTVYGLAITTVSLCNSATDVTLAGVDSNTLNFTIKPNGNPMGTQWSISISSDSFAGDIRYVAADSSIINNPVWKTSSEWGVGGSTNVGNLTPGLVYSVRENARNYNGIETGWGPASDIFLGAATPGTPQLTLLSPTSIRCVIDPVTNPSSTEYTVRVVNLNSGTTRYVKADYTLSSDETEVWQTLSIWGNVDIIGLTPNTLYKISNKARAAGNETIYGNTISTYTNAAIPLAGSFSGITDTAMTLNWGKNGNPDYTEYAVWLSTDSNYGTYNSTITLNASYQYTGLTANTIYYGKVRSRNSYGIESVWVELGSTTTLSSDIAALSPSNVSTDTIQANWQNNGNPEGTQYLSQISADNGFSNVIYGSGWITQTNFTFGPLTSGSLTNNTTYYFRVKSKNSAGQETGFVVLPSTVTLAKEPSSGVYSGITGTAITVSWTGNNPAGTEYLVQISADSGFAPAATIDIGWTTSTSTTIFNLSIDTAYYFRAKTRNYAGVETGYASLGSTRTLADVTSPTVELISLPGSTLMSDGSLIGVTPDSKPSVRFSEAMTETSVETAGNVIIRATRDNLGNTITTEYPGAVEYNSVTRQITYTPTNPLPKGYEYELVVTTKVKDTANLPLAEEKKQKFSTVMDYSVRNVYVSPDNLTKADIPANTVSVDCYVGISTSPAVNPLPDTTAKSYDFTIPDNRLIANKGLYGKPLTDTIREFGIYNTGGSRIDGVFNAIVNITIPYRDSDNDGIVDGSNPPVRVKTLKVYWLDETKNVWVRLPNSTLDKTARIVSVPVKHFSVYALAGGIDTDVSEVYGYPMPFRPNDNDVLTGTTAGGITFANIPSEGELKIFTISGELVREISFNSGSPTYKWDVKNDNGDEVVSGVYIWYIKSGTNSKKGKLMVIR